MSKFKAGDEVVLVSPDGIDHGRGYKKNQVFKIIKKCGPHWMINKEHVFSENQINLIESDYKKSNRNKLREHIKSLGFTAIDLSMAAGFSKYYFGSETSESRFNKRGDISDDRLLDLKQKAFEATKKLVIKSVEELKTDLEPEKTFTPNQNKELIEKLTHNQKIKPEKLKSKWIVSNKVFFTFVFIVSLLILFIATGVVKQVF